MATKTQSAPRTPAPVLKVTRYDTVSTTMIVVVVALAVLVFLLVLVWMSNHRFAVPPQTQYTVHIVENPGGFLDGTEGQTLGGTEGPPAEFSDLESSPENEEDPFYQETETVEPDVTETIDNVNVASTNAPPQMQQMLPRRAINVGERNEGLKLKRKGTGRKGLGDGPGVGGFGREQRWFVRFEEGGTLDEYAKQLDFFKIELGCILPEGVLVYLNNLAAAKPTERRVTATEEEQRLFFSWMSGARKKVDDQLFQKAGIDASKGLVLHFYPPEVEETLARQEKEYRGREPKDIAKTFFEVRPDGGGGYSFVVTGQVAAK